MFSATVWSSNRALTIGFGGENSIGIAASA
jgi:hypothetical protein